MITKRTLLKMAGAGGASLALPAVAKGWGEHAPDIAQVADAALAERLSGFPDRLADNIALLYRLREIGNIKEVTGGEYIYQEIGPGDASSSDVFASATYDWRDLAEPFVISHAEAEEAGRSKKAMLDLLGRRLKATERALKIKMARGLYSDGSAYEGKQIDGLDAQVSVDPATGTVGGIDRAAFAFWRNQVVTGVNKANILDSMRDLWIKTCKNRDKTDLIPVGGDVFKWFHASLSGQQRFQSKTLAEAGFDTLKFISADVVTEHGIADGEGYFLNRDHLYFRPHRDFNMVRTEERLQREPKECAVNIPIYWMGNLTMSNAALQGRLTAEGKKSVQVYRWRPGRSASLRRLAGKERGAR